MEKINPKTLHKISYGLYIVSSKNGDKINGQVANTVFQTTSEPPTLAVSIFKGNFTHECITKSNVFAISILSQKASMKFIGNFGFKNGRDFNKFKDVNFKLGQTAVPIVLDNSVGFIECEVANSFDVGTHTIFIGKVVNADVLNDDAPMTYDYYHKVVKGKAPKSAPTFIKDEKEEIKQDKIIMQKIGKITSITVMKTVNN